MVLPEQYSEVKYLGFGADESYIDKHHACYKSLFMTSVDEMFELSETAGKRRAL